MRLHYSPGKHKLDTSSYNVVGIDELVSMMPIEYSMTASVKALDTVNFTNEDTSFIQEPISAGRIVCHQPVSHYLAYIRRGL